MNFFGITHLGPRSHFASKLVTNKNLSEFPEQAFVDAFNRVDSQQRGYISSDQLRIVLSHVYDSIPPETEVSALINYFIKHVQQHGGETVAQAIGLGTGITVLRSTKASNLVGTGLPGTGIGTSTGPAHVPGIPAIGTSMTYSQFDSSGIKLTLQTFLEGVKHVQDERSKSLSGANPATEHHSHLGWSDARHKHARVGKSPQDKFITPLTSSQEIGWYSQTQVEKTEMKPKNSCAETLYASEMVKSGIYF